MEQDQIHTQTGVHAKKVSERMYIVEFPTLDNLGADHDPDRYGCDRKLLLADPLVYLDVDHAASSLAPSVED